VPLATIFWASNCESAGVEDEWIGRGEVANVARPDTILAWYRKLVARKFDGSQARRSPGSFFTAEVLTLRGLVTYYVLFFIHLERRRVDIAGITAQPDERWMQQIARNVTMEGCGALRDCRYLLYDRDTKYTQSFRAIMASGQVEPLVLPARSPNLNAYAERWVRSVKEECLSKVVLFGERSLRRALREYVEHFHAERNHQGKGNVLLFPRSANTRREGPVQCRERLGGLLRYYHQEAA
jgi:putative transposase